MPDLSARDIVTLLAVASSFGLAAVTLATGPRSWARVSFGAGMVAFGVEALAGYMLLGTVGSEERVRWAGIFEAAGLAALAPWGVFVAVLALYPCA